MAGSIGSLSARIQADASGFTTTIERAEKRLGKFADKIDSLGGLGSLFSSIGAGFSLGSLGTAIKSAIDDTGRLVDASAKLDIGVGMLERLELAAKLSGVEAETLHSAIGKLQQKIGEAAAGNKEAVEDFERLGFTWRELAGMDAGESFSAVASKVGSLSDAYERAAGAVSMFGKGGKETLAFLRDFKGSTDQAAEALGDLLSDEKAQKLDSLGDRFVLLQAKAGRFFKQLAVDVAEAFEDPWKGMPNNFGEFVFGKPQGVTERTVPSWHARQQERADRAFAREWQDFDEDGKFTEVWEKWADAATKSIRTVSDEMDDARFAFSQGFLDQTSFTKLMDKLQADYEKAGEAAGRAFSESIGRALAELQTPLEKFDARMNEALEMFEKTGNQRLLDQLTGKALLDEERRLGLNRPLTDFAAKAKGSVEAGSAVNRFLNAGAGRQDPQERVRQIQEALLAESKRQTEELKALAEAWGVADVGQ